VSALTGQIYLLGNQLREKAVLLNISNFQANPDNLGSPVTKRRLITTAGVLTKSLG